MKSLYDVQFFYLERLYIYIYIYIYIYVCVCVCVCDKTKYQCMYLFICDTFSEYFFLLLHLQTIGFISILLK